MVDRLVEQRNDLRGFVCLRRTWTTDTTRYDTRCYFNVRSKADMSRLNLPHGDDN